MLTAKLKNLSEEWWGARLSEGRAVVGSPTLHFFLSCFWRKVSCGLSAVPSAESTLSVGERGVGSPQ